MNTDDMMRRLERERHARRLEVAAKDAELYLLTCERADLLKHIARLDAAIQAANDGEIQLELFEAVSTTSSPPDWQELPLCVLETCGLTRGLVSRLRKAFPTVGKLRAAITNRPKTWARHIAGVSESRAMTIESAISTLIASTKEQNERNT